MDSVLIWWLNQPQAEAITEEQLDTIPAYAQQEYHSRCGRPDRGRLWAHKDLPDVCVDPWPETELARQLSGDDYETSAGGIVIWARDFEAISKLPGTITDLKLERIA